MVQIIYVDYDYYKSKSGYGGSKLTEEQFARNLKKAQAFVDRITFRRIETWNLTESEIPDYIKDAVCAVSEQMQAFAESEKNGALKTSESVGKQSVSYQYASGATQESILAECAMSYLHGTKFAYRGY